MRLRFGILIFGVAFAAFLAPVASSRLMLSLSSAWEFTTDPDGVGETEKWYEPDAVWPRGQAIQVPGCWEAQGVGGPGESHPTTPEQAKRQLRGSYVGAAWYRKRVEIPEAWKGHVVWLKVGGVNSQGWFWANGKFVAHVDSYCGSCRYDITDLVEPGREATIVARVRNDVPSRKGVFNWIQRFGGLYRSVELEATSDPYIESVHTVADATRGGVVWNVRVRSLRAPGAGKMNLTADFNGHAAARADAPFEVAAGQVAEVSAFMALSPLHWWSPETPNLYCGTAELIIGKEVIDSHCSRFGVKAWEVRGGDFYLNGRRYYLRGYGDDFVYPLTLCSPASKMFHVKHFQLAKAFGFNYVRLHTHCELSEYFEAADEVGMMIQPELPYYGARPSAGSREYFMPEADLRELVENYRDHVSLATYCTGNEGFLGSPTAEKMYRLGKQLDPTRLFLHQDGGDNRADNSDYDTIFEWDARLESATFTPTRPLVVHEYLNLALEEDPRNASRYTGALLPVQTLEDFAAEMRRERVDPVWALRCFDAGYRLQSLYQKQGLEKARRDPRLDGQIYWTIADVGAPYSSQGLLDQFWNSKHSTPQFFRQFNAPTVVLAELSRDPPIFAAGERISVRWTLSHFEATGAQRARLAWSLRSNGAILVEGRDDSFPLQAGVHEIAKCAFAAPALTHAATAVLSAHVETVDATPPLAWENSWDIWIFPATKETLGSGAKLAAGDDLFPRLAPRLPHLQRAEHAAPLLLTTLFDARARAALAAGRDVFLFSLRGWPTVRPGVKLGWWTIRAQAGTAVANHPAFGDFPHEGWLSPLFFNLVDRAVERRGEFIKAEPLMLGHGRDGYLLYVFQARAGKGRLLASGLDLLSGRPEADHLFRCMLNYAQSRDFQPQAAIDLNALPVAETFNGCARILDAMREQTYVSFLGPGRMAFVRAWDGRDVVRWQTDPVPVDATEVVSFRFVAGMGYASQPDASFTLFLEGRPLLAFGVSLVDATWKSADGRAVLSYQMRQCNREDSSGVMTLTLPTALVRPGVPLILEVRGSPAGSRRWVGVYGF